MYTSSSQARVKKKLRRLGCSLLNDFLWVESRKGGVFTFSLYTMASLPDSLREGTNSMIRQIGLLDD